MYLYHGTQVTAKGGPTPHSNAREEPYCFQKRTSNSDFHRLVRCLMLLASCALVVPMVSRAQIVRGWTGDSLGASHAGASIGDVTPPIRPQRTDKGANLYEIIPKDIRDNI